jgi:hypothetical protein
LLVSLALAVPARAASPRDELLRLVPEDVGLCVVVQNLKEHLDALLSSPFAEHFARTEVGASLVQSPQAAQLLMLRELFLNNIGLDAREVRDDIFGLAAVFAYRPGPPGKPEQEEALLLVRAARPEALHKLFDKINGYQKKLGDLKALEEKTHNGVKYNRRVEGNEVTYYCLHGPILLLTSQEDLLRRTLDRASKSDAEPLLARRLRELGAERALLTVWVNPRAFDAAIAAKVTEADKGLSAALTAFARYWKALEGAALSVHLDTALSLSLALRARTEELPAAARRFLDAASRPSAIWHAFPEDALVAEGSRIDLAAYLDLLGDFLTRERRDALLADLNRYLGAPVGKDFVKEVLPFIGPDWGLCVTAPRPGTKSWLPEGLGALRLSSGGATAEVDKAVLSGLHALAMLGVVAHNKQNPERTLRLLTLKKGDKELKVLAGEAVLPPGWRPAFMLENGFLLAATSPELLLEFSQRLAAAPPVRSAGFSPLARQRAEARTTNPAPPGELTETIPLLRISFTTLRAYVKEHRAPLAEAIARQNKMEPEDMAASLDRLLSGLQFLDRLEINQRSTAGQLILRLRVQTSQPLKK